MKVFAFLLIAASFLISCGEDAKNSNEEKVVIQSLRDSMHDPKSLEIISIKSVNLTQYEGFDDWDIDRRLVYLTLMKPKDILKPFMVYTVVFRGTNAYGALRLNTVTAVSGTDKLTGDFCHFIEDDKK